MLFVGQSIIPNNQQSRSMQHHYCKLVLPSQIIFSSSTRIPDIFKRSAEFVASVTAMELKAFASVQKGKLSTPQQRC